MPYLVQCCYMPGDTFGISAALAVTPSLNIAFLIDRNLADDKSKHILSFYEECGQNMRIKRIDVTDMGGQAKDIWRDFVDASEKKVRPPYIPFDGGLRVPERTSATRTEASKRILSYLYYDLGTSSWPYPVWYATERVAEAFKGDPEGSAKRVADRWKSAKIEKDFAGVLDEYAAKKNLSTLRDKVLVLWSRQSGKRGGAHAELDSSYQGILQLASFFCPTASVIIAGDEKKKETLDGSSAKIASIATRFPNTFDLSNMWDDPVWAKFGQMKRLAQIAFFKYISKGKKIVHVGMRSGNLEAMALMGMPVFFLEPQGSKSGDRMLAFEEGGIPYSRVVISRAPGLTGRWGEKFSAGGEFPATASAYTAAVGSKTVDYLRQKDTDFRNYNQTAQDSVSKQYSEKEAKGLKNLTGPKSPTEQQDWDIAFDNARSVVKGLPLGVPSSSLPAFDNDRFFYRGFDTNDIAAIARAVMKKFYAA